VRDLLTALLLGECIADEEKGGTPFLCSVTYMAVSSWSFVLISISCVDTSYQSCWSISLHGIVDLLAMRTMKNGR